MLGQRVDQAGVHVPAGAVVPELSLGQIDSQAVVGHSPGDAELPDGRGAPGREPALDFGVGARRLPVDAGAAVEAEDPEVPGVVHLVRRHDALDLLLGLPGRKRDDGRESPVTGLIREHRQPQGQRVCDAVQDLPVGVGRERLVGLLVGVRGLVVGPHEVHQVFPAARPRSLAGHDDVDVGDVPVVDPVHPCDLGAVVLAVATRPVAVEEDVRAGLLGLERVGRPAGERGYSDGSHDCAPADHSKPPFP